MFWAYVIKSQTTGKIYIGQTNDLEKRLKRHNHLLPTKKNSYTKINRGPWKLVYKEEFKSRKEVIKKERFLKSHKGRDWLKSLWAASSIGRANAS